MATIKDVASRARVSIGTVSNVLSGSPRVHHELRARVEQAIRELRYDPNHVARSLKSRNTKTLGIVITDITNPFYPLVVRGAEDAALKQGYLLTIFNTDLQLEREKTCLALFRSRRIDGILMVPAPNPDHDVDHITRTIEAGTPLVCLDRMPPKLKLDAVMVDNVKGARMCVRHLVLMGHRLIGALMGPAGLQNAQDRLKGYRTALKEADIPFDGSIVRQGEFRMEVGYRHAKDLMLAPHPPTALFAANGPMGMGALNAIQELGLDCPGHVSLSIFDDLPGASVFRPRLTVVAQPAYEIGYRGMELLIGRIAGASTDEKTEVIVLEPELKVRDSTGPPREAVELFSGGETFHGIRRSKMA
jgi:LacI family transcriptional regulator